MVEEQPCLKAFDAVFVPRRVEVPDQMAHVEGGSMNRPCRSRLGKWAYTQVFEAGLGMHRYSWDAEDDLGYEGWQVIGCLIGERLVQRCFPLSWRGCDDCLVLTE